MPDRSFDLPSSFFPHLLVPLAVLTPMFDTVSKKNVQLAPLLEKIKVNPATLGEDNALVSQVKVFEFVVRLTDAAGEESVPLTVGRNFARGVTNIVGDLFYSADTLRDCMHKINAFHELAVRDVRIEVVENEDTVDLVFDWGVQNKVENIDFVKATMPVLFSYYISFTETILASLWAICSKVLLENEYPMSVGFRYEEPTYVDDYKKTFGCSVLFEQERNFLRFPKVLCDRKIPVSLPQYHEKFVQSADGRMQYLLKNQRIYDGVTAYVIENLLSEEMSLDGAAKELHMTTRTLQRALKLQNTSFIEIRDGIRDEMAQDYLANTNESIEEISYQLGYADSSGFYVAFKRMHNTSPRAFRNDKAETNHYQNND